MVERGAHTAVDAYPADRPVLAARPGLNCCVGLPEPPQPGDREAPGGPSCPEVPQRGCVLPCCQEGLVDVKQRQRADDASAHAAQQRRGAALACVPHVDLPVGAAREDCWPRGCHRVQGRAQLPSVPQLQPGHAAHPRDCCCPTHCRFVREHWCTRGPSASLCCLGPSLNVPRLHGTIKPDRVERPAFVSQPHR